ncbi:amidohydrolase family protein [uncultured Microscilla sp.]|uniref:amidohydrolase family protein n=1 Tax=uncultured Microscilla sp. TaxID=432653 RepID=UPI00260B0289|nr:amidohydrolase family protein [uncultured Microscilla sp.]
MIKKITFIWALLLLAWQAQAQIPTPAKPQSAPIVLQGGIIHVGNGQIINNASIRFEKGIITEVGTSVNTSGARVINVQGKHVYPGLILPDNNLGLHEIGAVRSTLDVREQGLFNPEVRSVVAYNTDSEVIATLRSNGIMLVQVVANGRFIAGTSSIMELDGWNWEDAVHTMDEGIQMQWIPRMYSGRGRTVPNRRFKQQRREAENMFRQASAYAKIDKPAKINLKFEAMRGLFDGSKTLYLYANFAKDIVEGVTFAKKHGVKRIVLADGTEALKVADFLKEHNIPVILQRLHRLPMYTGTGVDHPYRLPYLLKKAGLTVGLSYDSSEPMGARNLPFQAGTAAAYGLNKEEALQLVTLNNAKILGIDKKVGSLEKGKQATIVVSKGDLLDMLGNKVEHAFIQGKQLDLLDKHKYLYKLFKSKYDAKKK